MAETMVSVLLPTYNRQSLLHMAVESVLGQTYPHFELIIVDDGSTDNTEEYVRSLTDERIRYYKLEENGGQAKARNYGIELARYDYIAFEDSDDRWLSDKLAIQMKAMEATSSEVGFSYHNMRYYIGNIGLDPFTDIPSEKKSGNIYERLLYDNMVACPTILAKKECLLAVGGFDTSMKSLEDYDLVLKMAKKYQALFIEEILIEVTQSENGVSAQSLNYLMASCQLLRKYKTDYLKTGMLNRRIEKIYSDAKKLGMEQQFLKLIELSLK